ncbi:hypothetical protein [Ramlibacter albus]|uniref:Uncharacterized protein n=1 Tax=Ramlibacter albus TaxID=2079448 RepID=A0A923MDR2_9BURK|nr:hypothetical protein [Ramlibacter albus]MBC5767681.1 hypothetical protein [Ramlibacter albus]
MTATQQLALEELGLDWHWDASEPVRQYIEREHPHLLRAYDADFLVKAIETLGTRFVSTQIPPLGTNPRS